MVTWKKSVEQKMVKWKYWLNRKFKNRKIG